MWLNEWYPYLFTLIKVKIDFTINVLHHSIRKIWFWFKFDLSPNPNTEELQEARSAITS